MRRKLEVIISPHRGYCFGVKRAMRLIEQGLRERNGKIYTLGEVIHNPQAVKRLKSRGVIPAETLDEVEAGSTIVIRAHGMHPDVIEEARRRGLNLLDATCPFVQRSQAYASQLNRSSYRVFIIGDSDHPEVKGLAGHAGGGATTIGMLEEVERIGPVEKGGVVIQTTFSRERAEEIIEALQEKVKDLRVYDTICQATLLRREATLELACDVDLMLVVGGRRSSNTKRLYQMCLEAGMPAKLVESADEIDPGWFETCAKVGLTTGTSTPDWVIENVLERLQEINRAG